jgi:hypothetical protein
MGDGMIKAWLDFEQKLIARAAATGWVLPTIQVRIAAGIGSLVVLVLLYEIL